MYILCGFCNVLQACPAPPRGFPDYFVAQRSCLGKSAKDPVTFKTLEPQGCDSLWQKDTKKAVLDYTAGLRACKMSHFAGSKARD